MKKLNGINYITNIIIKIISSYYMPGTVLIVLDGISNLIFHNNPNVLAL